MLKRALESGVPFGWVAGAEVYGNDRKLRRWLERAGIPHVLAIRSNEKLWVWTDQGLCQVRADRLTSQVDELGWTRCSAGDGAKGPRVYDWAVVEIRPLGEPGKGYWLLARRSIAQPGELAYFVCFGPAGTALEELVRVAGTRWAIEECFEEAKGQVGLDQYEVRRWGRLVPAHHLGDAGPGVSVSNQASSDGTRRKGGCYGPDEELIPITAPEVRRLLTRLVWTENQLPDFILSWSWWRRRHQARARCPASTIFAGWRQSVLPVHLLGLDALLGSVGPVAGDVKLQDDGVVHDPVNRRGGGHGVGALPQQNRYPTQVVASNKMLPKIGEAIAWEEASARWQNRNCWQQYETATGALPRRTRAGSSTSSSR